MNQDEFLKFLKKNDAPQGIYNLFASHASLKEAIFACDRQDWLDWLKNTVPGVWMKLPHRAFKEHQKAIAPALAKRDMASALSWGRYLKAKASAWVRCQKTIIRAPKRKASAFAQFKREVAQAFKKHYEELDEAAVRLKKVTAPLWTECQKNSDSELRRTLVWALNRPAPTRSKTSLNRSKMPTTRSRR